MGERSGSSLHGGVPVKNSSATSQKGEIKLYDLKPIYSSFVFLTIAQMLHQDWVDKICSRQRSLSPAMRAALEAAYESPIAYYVRTS